MAVVNAGAVASIKRAPLFALIWLLLGVQLAFNAVGFLLDELLFPEYRSTQVRKPTFILGIPRSGTTWLQRVLAKDEQFAWFRVWECLFAPSISQRYLLLGMAKLLSPFAILIRHLKLPLLQRLQSIHAIGLQEPEEDFLLLLPVQACFLMVLLCPESARYWQVARFDQALPSLEKRTIMRYYDICIRKHLCFHGAERKLLSKNPSFTPLIESLRQQYPDANIIACTRTPAEAVPSQLSSLLPAMKSLGHTQLPALFVERVLDMLSHFYQKLKAEEAQLAFVEAQELCDHLRATVTALYKRLELPLSSDFDEALIALENKGRRYQSQHHYRLEQFNLSAAQINARFSTSTSEE